MINSKQIWWKVSENYITIVMFDINGNIYLFIKNFLFLPYTLYLFKQYCKIRRVFYFEWYLKSTKRAARQIIARHFLWACHEPMYGTGPNTSKNLGDKEGTREGLSASMKVTRPRRRSLFLPIPAREEVYSIVRRNVGMGRQEDIRW